MEWGISKKTMNEFSQYALGYGQNRTQKDGEDFRFIQAVIDDNGITRGIEYYTWTSNGRTKKRVVVRSGSDYFPTSKTTSRNMYNDYPVNDVPAKYKAIVKDLIKIYNETEWSENATKYRIVYPEKKKGTYLFDFEKNYYGYYLHRH